MYQYRSIILTILLILISDFVIASSIYQPKIADPIIESWRWRHLTELDGKGVRCMDEDNQQVMWFGSDKGVTSYDGLTWKTYTPDNGLVAVPVLSIKATSEGYLYAGSQGGLSVWGNHSWRSVLADSALAGFRAQAIIELNDGSVLCGTNRGLFHIRNAAIDYYYSSSSEELIPQIKNIRNKVLIDNNYLIANELSVVDLLQNEQGVIWMAIGYDNGNSGKIISTRLDKDGNLAKFRVVHREPTGGKFFNGTHLFNSNEGELWNVTEQFDQGMAILGRNGTRAKRLSTQFGGDDIYTGIIQTDDGTIFLGAMGKFYILKDGKWKIYRAPQAPVPTSNRILIFEDSRGGIWLAGKQNEVFLIDYNTQNWATYLELNFQDQQHDNTRWFIDLDGKVIENRQKNWIAYSSADGMMTHPVRVYVTNYDEVWAIGGHKGVACAAYFKQGRWQKLLFPELSWSIDPRAIFQDRDGALWLGCNIDIQTARGQKGGTLKFPDPKHDKGNFIHYELQQKEIGVYGIGQSRDGKLWVAGISGNFFDGNHWQAITDPPEFQYHMDYMFTSPDSILWVGSRNYGLFRYDGQSWYRYNMDNGLSNNSITSIYALSDSLAWVSTAKGISYFDGKSWTNHIFPSQLNIVKEGGQIRMDHDGNLWLNHSSRDWYRQGLKRVSRQKLVENGYWTVYYHPDKVAPDTRLVRYEPEVSSIGNTTISWTGIDPFAKTATADLQYSFKLDDSLWTAFSSESSHPFEELPSGSHTLLVRSRDMDFNIDPSPLKIEFYVLYPFYLRPAFFIPILLLAGLSLFLLLRVIRRGKQLRLAKKETDDILSNIEQGLFLLDNQFRLGSQYSGFLKRIFNDDNLANRNLMDLLLGKVSAKDIEATQSFLNIMFRPDTDQLMLDELNPLGEIKMEYEDGTPDRYFSFRFRRIESMEEEGIGYNLIVVVQDITQQITLGKKLAEAKEDADRKMNWLMGILHVEPGLLQEFITSAENELELIRGILNSAKMQDDLQGSLEAIYRAMHLLKGNAGLLTLNVFADQAHAYEDRIGELKQKNEISPEELAELKSELDKISTSIHEVTGLLDRIGKIHNQMRTKRGYEKKQIRKSFQNLVEQVADDQDKNVKLNTDAFDLYDLPHKNQLLAREILVQLIKNAIAHGIERPEERKKAGKPEPAQVEIRSFKNESEYGLIVKDDGRGLQLEKLRERAVASKKFTAQEIDAWTDEEAKMSIFASGVSTSDKVDLTSGRGVGLDAVKDKVEAANGRIEVHFEPDKFCEFVVTFPVTKE